MAYISGAPTMPSESVNLGAMMIGQSPKEPLLKKVKQEEVCEEHYKKNAGEERMHQLTLSQCFVNKTRPFGSTSMSFVRGTPLTYGSTTRKRSKQMIKGSWEKSSTYFSCVMEKAKVLRASLDPRHPSFIKFLHRSHVTLGFWLGLPVDFCRTYLSNHDHTVKLEGDNGVQYETKFLAGKGGLSGGWRRFSLAHNLQEGDALVFHLVRQYEFKVYTVRANNLDHRAHERQLETGVKDVHVCQKMKNLVEVTPCLEENCQNDGQPETDYELVGERFSSESDKEDSPAETMDNCSSPGSFVDLKNFSIVVNGCPVDSELSWSARVKYYELCYARKSYLHDRLKSINKELAAGIILETVSIVYAIKVCSVSTSQTDLKEWEKTLESFKSLGMDVSFLVDRLRELERLAIEYQECDEAKRYSEAINEENHLKEKIASLERALIELKEAKINCQFERETLEAHLQKCNSTFQQMAKAPW